MGANILVASLAWRLLVSLELGDEPSGEVFVDECDSERVVGLNDDVESDDTEPLFVVFNCWLLLDEYCVKDEVVVVLVVLVDSLILSLLLIGLTHIFKKSRFFCGSLGCLLFNSRLFALKVT